MSVGVDWFGMQCRRIEVGGVTWWAAARFLVVQTVLAWRRGYVVYGDCVCSLWPYMTWRER